MSESLAFQQTSRRSSVSREKKCSLCGLPVRSSKAHQIINGEVLHFCCLGCQNVFQILVTRPDGPVADFRATDLYRACLDMGLIGRSENDLTKEDAGLESKTAVSYELSEDSALVQDLTVRVEGMWCPACSWLIEKVLRKMKGIFEARVLFLSDLARIKYLPHLVNPQEILTGISKLGYRPALFSDPSESSPERRDFIRLGVCSILTMNIMMISFALYFGFFQELGQEAILYFSYPLWLLSTPVLFYGGLPIFKRAYGSLRHESVSMDTLIAVGVLAAYIYSVMQVVRGSINVYFDTASMLITLVLLGRYVEAGVRGKISRGVKELYELANRKVRLSFDGLERWVTPEAVKPGDEFIVLAGETIPLDGRITSGKAKIDESILTGESRPVTKEAGGEVMGGTLLLERELKVRAARVGRESSLGQMIELMQEALSKKDPFEILSDRIMHWFVPAVLGLAACTALFLLSRGASIDVALLRAITVLVITCPCALGIASPLAKLAAIGKGRDRGILVQDPGALEGAKDLDVLIFDKTGTLTHGNFSLRNVVLIGVKMDEALHQIASVEAHSDHFLAREVVRKAKERGLNVERARSFEAFDGLGVRGTVAGREVAVGNRQFMILRGMSLPLDLDQNGRSLESKGMTVVFFAWDSRVQGLLVFGDTLKEAAGKTVHDLQAKGIETWLVSGDAEETTRAVAEEIGVDRFSGQALPNKKVEIIKTLQKNGHRVGMVGDGMNDAAALAQADVGFALGPRSNVGREASPITLVTNDPARILEVLDLSRLTVKTIRQNLLFAFVYNGLAIPLAIAGLLNPLIAVSAMFASSLSVIGNSLRITRRT